MSCSESSLVRLADKQEIEVVEEEGHTNSGDDVIIIITIVEEITTTASAVAENDAQCETHRSTSNGVGRIFGN